jgi:hypothetical protein
MSDPTFAMPVAVVPASTDAAAFYATFTGKVAVTPGADGLVIDLGSDPAVMRLYAPLKAAMRYVPADNSVLLETWPASYVSLRDQFSSPVPTRITFRGVDAQAVRDAVTPIVTALGRPVAAVDRFMAGDGLVRVLAGSAIGAAAPAPSPADASRPRQVSLSMEDATSQSVNAIQFLTEAATLAGIDATLHPLLNRLETEGWVEVFVLARDGTPLTNVAYVLYLSDDSVRTGQTDSEGRVFETGLPPGGWSMDLPEHPSFELVG